MLSNFSEYIHVKITRKNTKSQKNTNNPQERDLRQPCPEACVRPKPEKKIETMDNHNTAAKNSRLTITSKPQQSTTRPNTPTRVRTQAVSSKANMRVRSNSGESNAPKWPGGRFCLELEPPYAQSRRQWSETVWSVSARKPERVVCNELTMVVCPNSSYT